MLKNTGFSIERTFLEAEIYQQLFGYYNVNGIRIEVSFIQDKFPHLFQPVQSKIIPGNFPLEKVEDIYRRKTAIIIGLSPAYDNGRSKARDLMDLYVLSKSVMPIPEFIKTVWDESMLENFIEGLGYIDSLTIVEDNQYYIYPEWPEAESGDQAYRLLFKECGLRIADPENYWQEDLSDKL